MSTEFAYHAHMLRLMLATETFNHVLSATTEMAMSKALQEKGQVTDPSELVSGVNVWMLTDPANGVLRYIRAGIVDAALGEKLCQAIKDIADLHAERSSDAAKWEAARDSVRQTRAAAAAERTCIEELKGSISCTEYRKKCNELEAAIEAADAAWGSTFDLAESLQYSMKCFASATNYAKQAAGGALPGPMEHDRALALCGEKFIDIFVSPKKPAFVTPISPL